MNEILDILAQFGGGRGDPANLAVRFLLPTVFWSVLAFISLRQWRRFHEYKDLYIGIAAIAGIGREMIMFVAEYGGWRGYISFEAIYHFFPPFEHAATMLSGVLAGFAFMLYFLDWSKFSRFFVITGLSTIAILYLLTAPLWVSFMHAHPGAQFGSFWGDMTFRISASILMGTVLICFFIGNRRRRHIPLPLFAGFSFLFLDEFLMIFNLLSNEVHAEIFAPIRHNLHIWAIPFFPAVYWADLNSRLRRSEERLSKLNKSFLSFGSNSSENINRLTKLCGELLEGVCATYNRFENGLIFTHGKWNVPADYSDICQTEGNINYDVIKQQRTDVTIINNLHKTAYAASDPMIRNYHIMTYMGNGVKCGEVFVGALSTFYDKNFSPGSEDKKIMGIIASAIGVEEERRFAEAQVKDSQQRLRNLSSHLQSSREEERANIAREIHDELGQVLTALKLDMYWLEKKLPDDQEKLKEKVRTMSKHAETTIHTVQRISSELRPAVLDDLGLIAAIEWQSKDFQRRTNIQCLLSINSGYIKVPENASIALFRIYQEALTNVVRHAKAKKVNMSMYNEDDNIVLQIHDNGIGIQQSQLANPRSFGIIGIRERAIALGGSVEIIGNPHQGTTITVIIPLNGTGIVV
ncbi:MAG: sensor histidine kinase [Nitrospiraceae bacterium]|nr:MAG: sensor histidine kinase [Nitrospiraceae bacterium]